jgi:monoamine oxidase
MAGLAAAAALVQAGEAVTVLEARDRIGGRTCTDTDLAGFPVELGAELIHGDKVLTWELVRQLGLQVLPWRKEADSLVRLEDGRLLTMPAARAAEPQFNTTRAWDVDFPEPGSSEDFSAYLQRLGFTAEQLQYVRRSFGNSLGDEIRFISARAALDEIEDVVSGGGDFRLVAGYSAVYRHLAQGLDIRLEQPVTHITWGDGVTMTTIHGDRFHADHAVVTLPVGVLKAGSVTFDPPLPPLKQEALAGIGMGPVIKLIYVFAEAILPPETMAIYSRLNPPMWWSPSAGRETQKTVWTAFLSGDWARELLADGPDAALARGLATLRAETGRPDLQPVAMYLSNWPDDPYSQGGYSHVLAGHYGAREKLAQPTPPLYWAGEAAAPYHQAATVHGALATGRRAAADILAAR